MLSRACKLKFSKNTSLLFKFSYVQEYTPERKCKPQLFHCRWNTTCRASCSPLEARRESACLRWNLVAGHPRVASLCFSPGTLFCTIFVQAVFYLLNALCLCSAVNGILSWPEKMRDWMCTVAFSCFHPFGGGGKLSLKSQRGWCLCRDTSGLPRTARGRRRACVAVSWSLHLEMTTVWSGGRRQGPKPPDKSSSWGTRPPRTETVSGSAAWLVGSWIKCCFNLTKIVLSHLHVVI